MKSNLLRVTQGFIEIAEDLLNELSIDGDVHLAQEDLTKIYIQEYRYDVFYSSSALNN